MCLLFINFTGAFAKDISISRYATPSNLTDKPRHNFEQVQLNLASIELLIEQEVGRIVLPKIYNNIGITVEVTPFPGNRAQYAADSGMQDGEIMRIATYGNEALNTIRVPTPYYYLETMPFVLKNSDIVINSKQDLAQYRVAKIRGVKHTNNITKGLKKLYDMNSTENMFKLLLSNKVDVVLTNTMDGNAAISRLGLQNIVEMQKPLARLALYHYLHNKHDDLVPFIDKEINRLKANKEIDRLINNAEKRVMNFY
jgi:ABC-type amino acid transport substrate-binding protein